MGFEGPSRCVLYEKDSKMVEHLLYQCNFSNECWQWIKEKLNWTLPLSRDWKDHILGWPRSRDGNVFDKIWNITPAIMAWEIWKERNIRFFCNIKMALSYFFNKLEACISEVGNNNLKNSYKEEGSFSDWDAKIWEK